jgi:hypothetical protein
MSTLSLLAFLPDEALPLILVAGGFAIMFGQKKIALALFQMVFLLAFLPVLLEPFLDMVPLWALYLLMIGICLSMFGSIVKILLGKAATEQMVGSLAADFFKWSLFTPFRLVRWIFFRFRA